MFAQEEFDFIINNNEFYSIANILLENVKRIIKLSNEKNYLQTGKKCLSARAYDKGYEICFSTQYKSIDLTEFIKKDEDNSEIIDIALLNKDISSKLDEIYLLIREKIFNIKEKFNKFNESNSPLKNKISSSFSKLFIDLTNTNTKLDNNIYDIKLLCNTFNNILVNSKNTCICNNCIESGKTKEHVVKNKIDFLNKDFLTLYTMTIESILSATRQVNLEINALYQISIAILSNFHLIYKSYEIQKKCMNISILHEIREIANADINNSEYAIFKCNEARILLKGQCGASTTEEYEEEMTLLGV
jgi:hypothetical protein